MALDDALGQGGRGTYGLLSSVVCRWFCVMVSFDLKFCFRPQKVELHTSSTWHNIYHRVSATKFKSRQRQHHQSTISFFPELSNFHFSPLKPFVIIYCTNRQLQPIISFSSFIHFCCHCRFIVVVGNTAHRFDLI